MIKLTQLSLKNFFSHRDTNLDISSRRGLILIDGQNKDGRYDSNGSGKSTLLEGIVYALSGNTLRNVGVNDVVNRTAGKDTEVSISFTSSGKSYEVNRYRKHSINGDRLDVLEEGSLISKRLNKDTQSVLDSIVDIPYDVLVNTMLLGEGLSSRFTQLSDPDKKSLIESTLHLSYDLSKSKDLASSRLKSLKLKKATLEGQINTLDSILSEDLQSVRNSLEDSEKFIDSNNGQLELLSEELSSYSKERDSIVSKISLLRNSISRYHELINNYSKLDTENAHYIEEITRVLKEESPICSLCRQFLETEDSKESVKSNFTSLIESNKLHMDNIREELSKIPDISLMEDTVRSLEERNSTISVEIDRVSSSYRSLELKLVTCKRDIEHSSGVLANYENYSKQSVDLLSELNSVLEEISDYEYLYKLYSPTGIMVYVLEEAISYINTRIKVYTDVLLDKSYSLSLEKGKIVLKDLKGSSYQSLSNGEKRRLDICIQFSLHDYTHIYCGNSCNVLFCDEVLDTLDSTGVNNIIDLLSMKREYCNLDCIFVISHNSTLKSYFDEVVTVVKDKEGNSSVLTN